MYPLKMSKYQDMNVLNANHCLLASGDANVSGMMLFADGGAFASKPYAAGGR